MFQCKKYMKTNAPGGREGDGSHVGGLCLLLVGLPLGSVGGAFHVHVETFARAAVGVHVRADVPVAIQLG